MTVPKPEPNKVSITIRLRPSTVTAYRRTGRGWQTRLSDDLDRVVTERTAARFIGSKRISAKYLQNLIARDK
jgi:hypothetical protein